MNEGDAQLPLALQIQRLGGFNEQALVLLHAAELRGAGHSTSPGDVAALFASLHLPRPKNARQHLAQLRAKNLAMQPQTGRWATTPEGQQEIWRLMGDLDPTEFSRLGEEAGEPLFAGAAHHRIPASMAPALFEEGISRFLRDHKTERNVFLMVRYPREEDAYSLGPAISVCRAALRGVGMHPHLASDSAVDDQLFANVGVYLWSCNFGVAILENRERGLNYNVVLETGAMLMTGRRCLLLKDKTVGTLPTDLLAHIHKEVDLDRPETVEAAVAEWVTKDLGLN